MPAEILAEATGEHRRQSGHRIQRRCATGSSTISRSPAHSDISGDPGGDHFGLRPNRYKTPRSSSANLEADGALLHLPGGAVKLAVGAQVRRE